MTDPPASDSLLADVAATLGLDAQQVRRAARLATGTPSAHTWAGVVYVAGLAVGTALALAALLDMVAVNWEALGLWGRLGVAGSTCLLAAGLMVWLGPRTLGGGLAGLASAALVGPTLGMALDLSEVSVSFASLLTLWALVAVVFVVATRFVGTVVGWCVLADTALVMQAMDATPMSAALAPAAACVGVAAFHAGLGYAYEERGLSRWRARIQWGLFAITLSMASVFAGASGAVLVPLGIAAAVLLLCVSLQPRYFWRARDPFVVAAAAIPAMTAITGVCGRVLDELGAPEVFVFFALSLLLMVQGVLALVWLRLAVGRLPDEVEA